jgi:hypothetical protein
LSLRIEGLINIEGLTHVQHYTLHAPATISPISTINVSLL